MMSIEYRTKCFRSVSSDIPQLILLAASLVLLHSCIFDKSPTAVDSDGNPTFEVKVISSAGYPILGAQISGGFDWDTFSKITNEQGIAHLPSHAKGLSARIQADNHFSIHTESLQKRTYELVRAERQTIRLGTLEGEVLKMDAERIVTLTYKGFYRVYEYNNQGVVEIGGSAMPLFTATNSVYECHVFGDTLWVALHADEVVAFSLADIFNPIEILRFPTGGYSSLSPSPVTAFR